MDQLKQAAMSKSINFLTIYREKNSLRYYLHLTWLRRLWVGWQYLTKSHCICTPTLKWREKKKHGTNRIEKRQTFNTGISAFDSVNYWYDGDNLKHRCLFFALKLTLFIWLYRCKVHFDWNFGQYSGTGFKVTVCAVRTAKLLLCIIWIEEKKNEARN